MALHLTETAFYSFHLQITAKKKYIGGGYYRIYLYVTRDLRHKFSKQLLSRIVGLGLQ